MPRPQVPERAVADAARRTGKPRSGAAVGTPYDVGRVGETCAATGKPLQPGDAVFAALIDIPAEQREKGDQLGLARVDTAEEAWQGGFRPAGVFSYWRTTVPTVQERVKRFVDEGVLMELIERLESADDLDDAEQRRQRLAFRYVLVLLMLRKKLLRLDRRERATTTAKASAGGNSSSEQVWFLTPKVDPSKGWNGRWDEERTLRVIDPNLSEDELGVVTKQLTQIMRDGIDADPEQPERPGGLRGQTQAEHEAAGDELDPAANRNAQVDAVRGAGAGASQERPL